jgi:hypothetical protein
MNKLQKIYLSLFSALLSVNLNAQPLFTPATISENATGTYAPTDCRNTGNDVKSSINFSGTMSVNVWDGKLPGFGWDDHNSNTGYLGLPVDAIDPDVTLVDDGYKFWAIVVYHSNSSGGFICDFYRWSGSSYSLNSSTLLSSSSFGNSINIDGDIFGDFAIAWDDPGTGDIQTISGSTYSTSAPSFCTAGPISVSGTSGYIYPDVSIYTDLASTIILHYVYLNSGTTDVYVADDAFNSVCSGTSLANIVYNASSVNGNYSTPRIACPPSGGDSTDWAIAVMDYGSGTYDIVNFTDYSTTVISHFYTGGYPYTINGQNNFAPAISYDGGLNGIIVAWVSDYSSSGNFTPEGPIALSGNIAGDYNGGLCASGGGYMVVSTNTINYAYQRAISVAGRDYSNMMYTFYEAYANDILWKEAPYSNCHLRLSKRTEEITVSPNPFADELSISLSSTKEIVSVKLWDLTGKTLFESEGGQQKINGELKALAARLGAGVYTLHIENNSGEISNQKLIKM